MTTRRWQFAKLLIGLAAVLQFGFPAWLGDTVLSIARADCSTNCDPGQSSVQTTGDSVIVQAQVDGSGGNQSSQSANPAQPARDPGNVGAGSNGGSSGGPGYFTIVLPNGSASPGTGTGSGSSNAANVTTNPDKKAAILNCAAAGAGFTYTAPATTAGRTNGNSMIVLPAHENVAQGGPTPQATPMTFPTAQTLDQYLQDHPNSQWGVASTPVATTIIVPTVPPGGTPVPVNPTVAAQLTALPPVGSNGPGIISPGSTSTRPRVTTRHVSATNPCANGNSSRLMRNALRLAGGGSGLRGKGSLVLSCTANLNGVVGAASLIAESSLGLPQMQISLPGQSNGCFPVDPAADAPCPPSMGSGLTLDCPGDLRSGTFFGGARVRVSATIPPVRVIRSPFPRGLVTQPNFMVLDGAPNSSGEKWSNTISFPAQGYLKGQGTYSTCSLDPAPHAPPCGGDVRNYQLGAKLDRLAPNATYPLGHVEDSCWTWGDWMKKESGGCGMSSQHTYETASHTAVSTMGGTIKQNGPRVDLDSGTVPSWDLEAYQATVPTFWAGSYAIKWDIAVVNVSTSLQANPGASCHPNPIPQGHIGDTVVCDAGGQQGWMDAHYNQTVTISWQHHEQGWQTIDLRKYGGAKWYFTSYKQYECGQFNGRLWCQQPSPEAGSLPVPIIEVQPILVDCKQQGLCQ